jgi:peroxiredoxin
VGISADAPDTNREWARALKLPFRLLSDTDGRASRGWGAWDDLWRLPRRTTFIVDRAGRVRWVEAGGAAIETSHALAALEQLARSK